MNHISNAPAEEKDVVSGDRTSLFRRSLCPEEKSEFQMEDETRKFQSPRQAVVDA